MKEGRSQETPDKTRGRRVGARTRILEAANELFRRHGTRAVGIDTIVERSGVAKMSLYRHFGSKQALIVAFLQHRAQTWTEQWLRVETERRASTAAGRLLATFDVLDDWFHAEDFEGCAFTGVMLEHPVGDPVREAATAHLAEIRRILRELADAAGIADPAGFADVWHTILKGAVISACEGDLNAARAAKPAAALYLRSCLPQDAVLTAAS